MATSVYERLVDSIYSVAFDDSEWSTFTAMLETELGVDGIHLLLADAVQPDPHLVLSRLYMYGEPAHDIEDRYLSGYFARDERVPRVLSQPVGQAVHNRSLYTPTERRRTSATWNEFLSPLGGTNQLVVRLSEERHDVWTVTRGTQTEFEAGRDRDDSAARASCGTRMANVRRSLSQAEVLGAVLTVMLERATDGVVLLDGKGRIMHSNRRSRELLGFSANAVLTDTVGTSRSAVASAVRNALPTATPPCASVVHVRNDVGERLALSVCPIRSAVSGEVSVLVLVSLLDVPGVRLDPADIAAALGLTRAEAEVAAEVGGGTYGSRDRANAAQNARVGALAP